MANGNPYSDFLDGGSAWGSLLLQQMPQATYFSSPQGQGFGARSPRRQRYFQQGFQDMYNQYMGALGTDIRGGGSGNITFDQFLQTNPWTARYAQLPQAMRGANTGMQNPRTRFLYY
jgi:hypothetical protein